MRVCARGITGCDPALTTSVTHTSHTRLAQNHTVGAFAHLSCKKGDNGIGGREIINPSRVRASRGRWEHTKACVGSTSHPDLAHGPARPWLGLHASTSIRLKPASIQRARTHACSPLAADGTTASVASTTAIKANGAVVFAMKDGDGHGAGGCCFILVTSSRS